MAFGVWMLILKSALDSVGIIRAAHGRKSQDYSTGMKNGWSFVLLYYQTKNFVLMSHRMVWIQMA